VPKREYALKDINLIFGKDDDGVILLVGRSASGKSTMLRLIAGIELPTQGCVSIDGRTTAQLLLNGKNKGVTSGMPTWIKVGKISECVQPVILDGKPDFDDSLPVMERVIKMGLDEDMAQSEVLARDFVTLLGLDGQSSLLPSELSPSEQYLFSMACGCMKSVAPAIKKNDNDDTGIPYPILLLDELFDTEVPSTVEKCNKGITNLIKCGAVVISATHRPNYFTGMSSRVVTLSGGKVLTDFVTS
jgi:ABC-type ATPase involved in cell division